MVISASLQACGVVFPFAMLTSICRSIVTICSGLYLLIGMTRFSSKWILSHSTWYKVCRSGHAWLYDLLNPHVDKLVVCNPRKNALLKDGNKSDRIDARKLAELLRGNQLKPVYHGETGVRMLRELSRSYLTIVKDLSRVMNRLKAVYRSWAIPCAGRDVYYRRHRAQWLAKI